MEVFFVQFVNHTFMDFFTYSNIVLFAADGRLVINYFHGGSHVSFPANFAVVIGAQSYAHRGDEEETLIPAGQQHTIYFPNGGNVCIYRGRVFTTIPMNVTTGCYCYISPGGYVHFCEG